jgi:shikimate kinase
VSGSDPAGERILLVGMMGAGKSTTGRLLAGRLGWAYLDSDEQVERDTGRSVPQIFATEGEAAFRAAESRVLAEALAAPGPAVVSVAGGAVLDPANRVALAAAGPVVWLRARPETLAARVGDGAGRPLLEQDQAATLAALDEVRRPLYAELATVVVDVDRRDPEAVVAAVLAALGREAGA